MRSLGDHAFPNTPAIDIRDLTFRWRAQDPVILQIDRFTLASGERVFLAGPSGSGKTSLLNLIAGVVVATAGSVSVLGTDLSDVPGSRRDRFRTDHLGIVFQMFNLVPYLSLIENVLLPCWFSRARRARAGGDDGALAAEAARLLQALHLDVATLRHRPVVRLSTGQQQRVAVARALIGGPDIIICDEPTSALDADARRSFLDLLFGEIEGTGTALIFASHDRSLESRFKRTIVLPEINAAWSGPATA